MPFDGNGQYNLPSPAYPAVAGTLIDAQKYNQILQDIANALSNTLARDGQSAWLGTPANLGLANVDNTHDVDKPLSNAIKALIGDGAGQVSFRNRVINPEMSINQRGAGGATVPTGSSLYPVDRWQVYSDLPNLGAGPGGAPIGVAGLAGFKSCLSVLTPASGSTPTAAQVTLVMQKVEGYHIQDWKWGTTGAKAITVGFYAYSSMAGTYSVALKSGDGGRSYIHNFTLVANIWTYVTFTVPGDTSGTWNTGNGIGLTFAVTLAAGSSFQTATTDAWVSGNYYASAPTAQFTTSPNASFYLTGVQIELGTVATPFERRPYGVELLLCQRYFQTGQYNHVYGAPGSTYQSTMHVKFNCTMRTTPTVVVGTPTASISASATALVALNNSEAYSLLTASASANAQYAAPFTLNAEL